jgi:hypothetical protein
LILSRKPREIFITVNRVRMKEIGKPQRLEHLHSDFNLKGSGMIMKVNRLISAVTPKGVEVWTGFESILILVRSHG